ncbi:unnamed protein product [Ceratitis capitata]|uniref:(Mediterranean fruit fly) hypothetical protein n=1 Tax=Ceratitis capitata TaxID=7213 RepID=A0A811UE16_CERCA|nr:unnamed protein product [Ceratitis capitata]
MHLFLDPCRPLKWTQQSNKPKRVVILRDRDRKDSGKKTTFAVNINNDLEGAPSLCRYKRCFGNVN